MAHGDALPHPRRGHRRAIRWATRADYEAYLAWRGQTGDTAMFREMLVKPMEVRYYDEVFRVER